jgi:hypothetical protein
MICRCRSAQRYLWEQFLQVGLSVLHALAGAQGPSAKRAVDVGVHREGRHAEGLHHHHAGGLVAHAGQGLQGFHGALVPRRRALPG